MKRTHGINGINERTCITRINEILVIKKFNENDRLSTAQVLEVTRSKRKID